MERNITIVEDKEGKKIVFIHDICFKGKRNIQWDDVEQYLKKYIGEFFKIADTGDIVYIGTDLPDEYSSSNYTAKLKGTLAKAKANAAQGIPELISIASNESYSENFADKHNKDAKLGWYRYDVRFALPVYDNQGDVMQYNVFCARMLIRHAIDGKRYLYDIINIKKETSTPL